MAAMGGKERPGVSLTRRSLILIGVAILWVGAAAGFGIGYKVEQSHTKSPTKTATAKANAKTNTAAKTAQLKLARFRVCLAGQGLRWPSVAGKFATQLKTPPPGVDAAKYRKGLTACYIAATKGSHAPPTTVAAA
jgi:hypothetical protein